MVSDFAVAQAMQKLRFPAQQARDGYPALHVNTVAYYARFRGYQTGLKRLLFSMPDRGIYSIPWGLILQLLASGTYSFMYI